MQPALTPAKASPFRYTFSAMSAALLVLFGYVLGSVPTGLLVGWAFGVDVRKVGSGNIGMANVLRAAGKWPAALTMLGDMLKGLLPVVIARTFTDNPWVVAVVGPLPWGGGRCAGVLGLQRRGGGGDGGGRDSRVVPLAGRAIF